LILPGAGGQFLWIWLILLLDTNIISYNAGSPSVIDVTDPLSKKPILNILFVNKNNGPTNSKLNYYKLKK
jgi:hypothetical protein